jgi:hypothetical protein
MNTANKIAGNLRGMSLFKQELFFCFRKPGRHARVIVEGLCTGEVADCFKDHYEKIPILLVNSTVCIVWMNLDFHLTHIGS